MPDNKEIEITELDENALDAVSGGVTEFQQIADGADVLGCKDNTNCPECTTNSGNCVAGCT